ncbi:ABC transporter family protein [Murinocardiopsis flavida]|uniref:ABC transporter family protein n=1 Tax=Murinocardiopsis flavida TaxID=645275 RepID=A0A2P8DSW9_9ACTN|nr:ABC transporter family protein [Murinocardiopsis flavida]
MDGVDLVVRRGEIYGIVGPRGAGKSTVLRLLAGRLAATSGEVRVVRRSPYDRGELDRVAALVECPALPRDGSGSAVLRSLTGYGQSRDTVPAQASGGPISDVTPARAEAVLETVGLSDRAEWAAGALPSAATWRFGIAAALLDDPELLLLDEPIAGVDPAGVRELGRLLRSLAGWGHTVVIASRNPGRARTLCDRVGRMSHGRLVAEERSPRRWRRTWSV